MEEIRIAIIDDDEIFAATLKETLEEYNVDFFTSSEVGILEISKGTYDILILDYFIDNLTGLDVVNNIRESNQDIYILLLTGYSQEIPALIALKKIDIQDYCEKNSQNAENISIRVESAVKSVMQLKKAKNLNKVNTFGQRLKLLRSTNCESQLDLANKIKVSRQTIAGYETERNEPNFEILRRICEHYKVSSDYLIGIKFVS